MKKDINFYTNLMKKPTQSNKNKNNPVLNILPHRAFNTAFFIIDSLDGIPFEELSLYLYLYLNDVNNNRMKSFTRLYEQQIELASVDPEKFCKNIHKFYNTISNKIKKENLYREFFEFYSVCAEEYNIYIYENLGSSNKLKVLSSYMSLLAQNFDYLKKDKFNFNIMIAGIKTTDEIIYIKDPFPKYDIPMHNIELLLKTITDLSSIDEIIAKEYRKYGIDYIKSFSDLEYFSQVDQIYSNMINALIPFINEYTFDILPQTPFSPKNMELSYDFIAKDINIEVLKEKLSKRKKTIPPNGFVFKFSSSEEFIKQIFCKEINHRDNIYMLYKITTVVGDISGFYNTSHKMFFNVLADAQNEILDNWICALVLYSYAIVVCNDDNISQNNFSQHFYIAEQPITIEGYPVGGKLKNVYDKNASNEQNITGAVRIGNEKYSTEERTVQGFIRKVGEGRSPSKEAVEYAKQLGYDLAPDETYVRPFSKQVYTLKPKSANH